MRGITGVREATLDDVGDVARIHKARFSSPELTLGQFSVSLISKLYASFLGRYVFLVHVSERGVNGFLVGGGREELFNAERAFIRNNLLHCCAETLLHPHLWPALFRSVRKIFLPRTIDFVRPLAPRSPRLLSLAVDEAAQGSGAATALVKAFEAKISTCHPGYWLTVNKTNHRAVRFYERMGMMIVVDAFPTSFMFQKEFEPPDDMLPGP